MTTAPGAPVSFVARASNTRMFTYAFAQLGLLDYGDEAVRRRWFQVRAWVLPVIWPAPFLYIQSPLFMVTAGGIAIAVLLLLVVLAAYQFRYRSLAPELQPSRAYDVLKWLSILAILGVGVKALVA